MITPPGPYETVYHFVGSTLRDGRPIPADNEWLVHEGPIHMCQMGLHGSLHPFDALQYAPGPILCRVTLAGIEDRHHDKLVGRYRRIKKRIDVTTMLRAYACDEALRVLPTNTPLVVRTYLVSRDPSLREAAWEAAWEAARGAAREAAWKAAWEAAREAAQEAARVRFEQAVISVMNIGGID